MCGIVGFVNSSGLIPEDVEKTLDSMISVLSHRGPDDSGKYLSDNAALGHTRLSIIDLSSLGRQPMANEDGTVQITFNGEIYNFPVLRKELVSLGHTFTSHTDTEVLVHGYEQWGLDKLLKRLQGMFAFAVWDEKNKKLFLARDHFGIKPLYYFQRDNEIVFASEVKALLVFDDKAPEMNLEALLMSTQHVGLPAPFTMYNGYKQLETGTWISFDLISGESEHKKYWNLEIKPDVFDPKQAEKLLWEAICTSVEKHLIADVPVGLFLSGGLDSSLVAVACAEMGRKLTCLTIALDSKAHDESPYAAALCKKYGLPHQIEPMDSQKGFELDPRLAEIFDEPFGSSAALSTAYITRIAAKNFKVMLSGEGGDELLGGYKWYKSWCEFYGDSGMAPPLWCYPKNTVRGWLGRKHMSADPMAAYAALMGAYPPKRMKRLFVADLLQRFPKATAAAAYYHQIDCPALSGFDRLQHLDRQLFLPAVCLTKMDRCSMDNSLEVRVPILDKTVASLTGRIAVDVRNPGYEMKGLLKNIAEKKLPEAMVNKKKQGFSTPIRKWFPKNMILDAIKDDMRKGNWWEEVFAPTFIHEASRLRGRPLWRLWHTWRWVKKLNI